MRRVVSGQQFFVEIDGLVIANFAECTGLSVETEVFEYAEGGQNASTHRLPVRTKYGNITLRRGIITGVELFDWFAGSVGGNPNKRKNLAIILYGPSPGRSSTPKELKRWDIRNAYPVRWIGPDLKTESASVAVETVEFAHDGFIMR